MCLASMGNYLFETDTLVQEVVRDAANDQSAHDFGKSIISELYKHARVFVYDFAQNTYPGQEPKERGYWRDVGNIDVYYQANMDLVDVEPIFNLYNDRWPIYTQNRSYPPAKFVFNDVENERVGYATDSLVCDGCIISGGHVHQSVLSPKVRINSFSEVSESILFENVTVGRRCRIRHAIVDKNVEIPAGMTIGYDEARGPQALPRHPRGRGGHPQGNEGRERRAPARRHRRKIQASSESTSETTIIEAIGMYSRVRSVSQRRSPGSRPNQLRPPVHSTIPATTRPIPMITSVSPGPRPLTNQVV